MKQETFANVLKQTGDDTTTDALLVAHNDNGDVKLAIKGNAGNIAKGLFAVVCDDKSADATELVKAIFKDVIYNAIKNNTAFGKELEVVFSDAKGSINPAMAAFLTPKGEA